MSTGTIPLLPCPWCGSDDLDDSLVFEGAKHENEVCVQCGNCGAQGPAFDWNNDGVLDAASAWNKGPYADRFEIHANALTAHANALVAKANEHQAKAAELLEKAKAVKS